MVYGTLFLDGLHALEEDMRSEEILPTHVSRATSTLRGQSTPLALEHPRKHSQPTTESIQQIFSN
jgi:hypothetical protein